LNVKHVGASRNQ